MKSAEQTLDETANKAGYGNGAELVKREIAIAAMQAFASQQCGGVWVKATERLPEVGQDVITIHPITRTKSFLIYETPSDFEDGEEWLDESTPCRCLELEKEIESLKTERNLIATKEKMSQATIERLENLIEFAHSSGYTSGLLEEGGHESWQQFKVNNNL